MVTGDSHWQVDTDLPAETPKGLAKVKKAPKEVPIIIDFGSWQCRSGFANESSPSLVFDQMVHRVNDKDGSVYFAVGRNIPSGSSKTSSRSSFDSGLVVHFTSVERTLDCIFDALKQSDGINHPIILTELFGNPDCIRNEFMELLFEGYGVPRLAFADDMVPSLLHNRSDSSCALILSFGHYFTTLGLYANGKIQNAKRLNYGGYHAADLLLRTFQCKYPSFPVKMSASQANAILWRACSVADDFLGVLRELESPEGIAKHDFVVQYPYPKIDVALEQEKEVQAAALVEKRREMAERLRERAAAKRNEKLKSKEDHLKAMQSLLSNIQSIAGKRRRSLGLEGDDDFRIDSEDMVDEEHFEELRVHGFESISELEDAVAFAEKDLRAYRNKIMGITEEKEEPNFDLVDIPDDQLNQEQLKEKRKQRLLKASADAREKSRIEKEEQTRMEAEKEKKDIEWRDADFVSWKTHYYEERSQLLSKIKSRQKQREALADRRSQASSVRLRNVMSLVDDDGSDKEQHSQSKKKKAKRSSDKKTKDQGDLGGELDEDDGFGAKDSDWQIYREIRRTELSDEEEDERDQERLTKIEGKLEEHDSEFYDIVAEEMSQKATIIDLLRNGGKAKIEEEESDAVPYQIHVNVERFRIPEVYFQPHIAGIDQAGIVEMICDILKGLDDELTQSLLSNIFLCGGMSQLPGLEARLLTELTKCFPVGTHINMTLQSSPLDCWKGLASRYDSLQWISKSDFGKKYKNK